MEKRSHLSHPENNDGEKGGWTRQKTWLIFKSQQRNHELILVMTYLQYVGVWPLAAKPRAITISLLALKAVNEFLISHGHLLFIYRCILPCFSHGAFGCPGFGKTSKMNKFLLYPAINTSAGLWGMGFIGKGPLHIDRMLRFRRTLCNHIDIDRDKYHTQFPPMNVKPGKGNLVTLNKSYSPGMDFLWLDLELSLASKPSLLSLLPKLNQKPNA